MSIDPLKQEGAFSWNELMTTDVAGAKAFYSELFNWTLKDANMEGIDYTLVSAGGQEVGGIMPMPTEIPAGTPPHWGAYVTVNDVDAKAKQAESLGGKVLLPAHDIPEIGRFCVIADPQGATLMIISYSDKE